MLLRLLLVEEMRPDPKMYPKVHSPRGLLPEETEYIDYLDEYILWLVKLARKHGIWHNVLTYTSGISALAIPFALTLMAPGWVPASLALLTAVGQFVQASGQNQKLSMISHEQASRIQRAKRDFGFGAATTAYDTDLRERFKTFRQTVEQIKEESGIHVFRIRGQEPPQIGTGYSGTGP
ncbi:MAG: hypothetical protein ACR2FQ_02990 [Pseudonocardiaceae bacterium]